MGVGWEQAARIARVLSLLENLSMGYFSSQSVHINSPTNTHVQAAPTRLRIILGHERTATFMFSPALFFRSAARARLVPFALQYTPPQRHIQHDAVAEDDELKGTEDKNADYASSSTSPFGTPLSSLVCFIAYLAVQADA